MVDPGHGGKDSGTIGLHGVEEKAITLATGLALRRALLATGRFRVGMTRTTDVFVTLAERVALAMGAHADLFFSLHCNEFARSAVRGAIVFTLSLSRRIRSDGCAGRGHGEQPGSRPFRSGPTWFAPGCSGYPW
ncbi:MAG: N-acetylmuramoyl-L-alanine amidase family protein [Acetobacteraceae bacterium]